MKLFSLLLALFYIPEVASAHSGTALKTVINYLPFLAPLLATLLITGKSILSKIPLLQKFFKKK